MTVELKPITTEDYKAFFGELPKNSIRGYSFVRDGEMVAVMGVIISKDGSVLFSDIKGELQASPVAIWRWSKRALDKLHDMRQPLVATTQSSEKFLNSLGFVFRGDTKYGKMFEYMG